MSLITKCICGSTDFFETAYKTVNFPLLACENCGIIHQQVNYTEEEYHTFYTKYHCDFQEHINRQSYQDRYEHDYEISKIRLDVYQPQKFQPLDYVLRHIHRQELLSYPLV